MAKELSKDLIERLELLVKSDHWKSLVEFVNWRMEVVEDVLYSLKIDKYQANGSTILIKKRESYLNVLKIGELVSQEYDEEKTKHMFNEGIQDLITELEGGTVKKK